MDLNIWNVVLAPVISSKAYKLGRDNQIMLYVHVKANAPTIKSAVEKLFNVKVARVNTSIKEGKLRRVARRKVAGSTRKVAYVTLQPGYNLDFFSQAVQDEGSSAAE